VRRIVGEKERSIDAQMAATPAASVSGTGSRRRYRYQLTILQAEFSLTQVLDEPVTGRIFFEEVIRENLDIGRRLQPPESRQRWPRWRRLEVRLEALAHTKAAVMLSANDRSKL
jgi:hypothetical protein